MTEDVVQLFKFFTVLAYLCFDLSPLPLVLLLLRMYDATFPGMVIGDLIQAIALMVIGILAGIVLTGQLAQRGKPDRGLIILSNASVLLLATCFAGGGAVVPPIALSALYLLFALFISAWRLLHREQGK